MFFTLLQKEIFDYMRSLRFILGLLVMFSLVITAVVLLAADVKERSNGQDLIEKGMEEWISNYAHTNRVNYFLQPSRPIERTEILFRGLDNPAENNSFFSDPLAKLFPKVDLLYIISILISLLAIIFTYDSICGEREVGTLKLIHTGPVSRASVVLSKWTGALIVIYIPFLVVMLAGVLVGSYIGALEPDFSLFVEIGSVAIATLLYTGFFVALGMLVSGTVKQSGTSMLVLLFLWVVFVLAIPNISPLIASQVSPIPSVNAVERQARLLTDTIRDNRLVEEDNLLIARLRKEYNIPETVKRWREPEDLMAIGWTREQAEEFLDLYTSQWRELLGRINREQNEKAQALRDDLNRKIEMQSNLARGISLLSPTASFTYFSSDITSVGLRAEQHFGKETEQFYSVFGDYLREKRAEQEAEHGIRINANSFIDLSDRPRFSHRPEDFGARFAGGVPYLGHLAIMMLIALLASVVLYLRYDIR